MSVNSVGTTPITAASTGLSVMGANFATITGPAVTVEFRATGGATPFDGGTSAMATVPGTIVSSTEVQCTPPPATICGGPAVQATVEVHFPSGIRASSATPVATFAPPTLTALDGVGNLADVPSTVILGTTTPSAFTITGAGFGPVGAVATVTFGDPGGASTAFNGNPSVDVSATIMTATSIVGVLPVVTSPRLTADEPADVTITLPSGSCATSANLANFNAPPTITMVTNNRAPFDQASVTTSKPQTFLACVPTDLDIDGTAFDPAATTLFYDTGAGPGTPIGSGLLGSPAVSATNISGTCPVAATLTTSTPTTARVLNPDQQYHTFPVTYSVNDALWNVNSTAQPSLNSENLIVVNPTNPANAAMFVHADPNYTLFFDEMTLSYTTDYGATWTITTIDDAVDGYPDFSLRFDPAAAFDRFGNLYICYGAYDYTQMRVIVLQSTDGGATFANQQILAQSFGFSHDRWTLATGPEPLSGGEAVYAAWTSFSGGPPPIVVNGCVSTGLGNLSVPFAPPATPVIVSDGPPPGAQWQNGYPEVGPNGELYVTFFDIPATVDNAPGDIYFDVDADGLWDVTNSFGTDQHVATSNVGWDTYMPPQQQRGYGANPQVVSVRAGMHTGRLLLCYTQEVPDDQSPAIPTLTSNTLVVVRISDDQGATWGPEIPVHTDTPEHQFMHWLTCDRGTGELYVTWYDCRNDVGNTLTQRMSASSQDGVTWTTELLLAQGQSDASPPNAPLNQDYLEYCGTAAHDGCVYASWTDFSNFTGDNPDGTSRSDVYVSVYMQR